jgi:DNA adenine methylase
VSPRDAPVLEVARKVPPAIKWHGGKQRLARRLIALMSPHTRYVEPYFGGGAVLFARDPTGVSEVVNDRDRDLTNFWRVLQQDETFARFQRLVEAVPFSAVEFEEAQEALGSSGSVDAKDATGNGSLDPVAVDVERAVAFFITCRQSLAGRREDFAPLTRTRLRRGMNEQASAWLTAVEGLPLVHARLRRVVILDRDALEVIRSQDGPGTLFYLDPPFLPQTRAAPDVYAHEMSLRDRAALLVALGKIQGKFLLSGYPHELYALAERQYGWRRVEFDMPNDAAGGDRKRRMTECVWMNF